jgi:sec-independent protein translocase protein TatA
MFGIGGGELVFIIFIALMLFGSDKIPEMARTLGKAMAQLKNATNDIKSEITKSADANGIDLNSISSNFSNEMQPVQQEITNLLDTDSSLDINKNIDSSLAAVNKIKESIEEATGPVKRQI